MTERTIEMLESEYWWGGVVHCAWQTPIHRGSCLTINQAGGECLDQGASVMISSAGRVLWSECAFDLRAESGLLHCTGQDEIYLEDGFCDLRGAYKAACARRFPFMGKLPDLRFFSRPQYNTWIELGTNQTAEAILEYARGILKCGLPAGILMIDEGWAEDYGVFAFNRGKIPDPEGMICQLHDMGFAVMMWMTPLVAAAGPQFKRLRDSGYLLRDKDGSIAIREWWNGFSAVIDLTNPDAYAWLNGQMHGMMKRYGVDGFKLDAGDSYFYRDSDRTYAPISAREQTKLYNQLGEAYALNEFRAAWNCGGHPIVARLQDKLHAWDYTGLLSLIPHTVTQGLLGYTFCCPDMVGGGDCGSFGPGHELDGELVVRWAQASACMGMVQMSIAPWRVLSVEHAHLVADALRLHACLGEEIVDLARRAAKSGEPIVRHMAYVFPDEGFEMVNDQFMLGDTMLICPVLEKGAAVRRIRLPRGEWESWRGEKFTGGCEMELSVLLEDIPRFRRII